MSKLGGNRIRIKKRSICYFIAIILLQAIMSTSALKVGSNTYSISVISLIHDIIHPNSQFIFVPIFFMILFNYLNRNYSEAVVIKYIYKEKVLKHNLIYIFKLSILIALAEVISVIVVWSIYFKRLTLSVQEVKAVISLIIFLTLGFILFGAIVLAIRLYIRKNKYLFLSAIFIFSVDLTLFRMKKNSILANMTMYYTLQSRDNLQRITLLNLASMIMILLTIIIILETLVKNEEYMRLD